MDNKPDPPRHAALMTQLWQTQPMCTEPASSWALPNALSGATPHSQVGSDPIKEMKMDAQGFSVAPWLRKHQDSVLTNAPS